MTDVKGLRGQQVRIGKLAFAMPQGPPKSDEDIVDTEDLVARIELELAPYKDLVKKGQDIQKALRKDITSTMEGRIANEREAGMFDEFDDDGNPPDAEAPPEDDDEPAAVGAVAEPLALTDDAGKTGEEPTP